MDPIILNKFSKRRDMNLGYDEKADIWSIGTVCYELLIGKAVFNAKTMNDLVDRVSFSNLIVNRLGYISIVTSNTVGIPKIKTTKDKNKTMKEFILFWLFDYQLLPKEDNKKAIIKKLRSYIKPFNHFFEFNSAARIA